MFSLYKKHPDLMAEHGLRSLVLSDRLLWMRIGHALVLATMWIAFVLWLLSRWYEIGPYTIVFTSVIGIVGGFIAMADVRMASDRLRWPRGTMTPRITSPPSRSRR